MVVIMKIVSFLSSLVIASVFFILHVDGHNQRLFNAYVTDLKDTLWKLEKNKKPLADGELVAIDSGKIDTAVEKLDIIIPSLRQHIAALENVDKLFTSVLKDNEAHGRFNPSCLTQDLIDCIHSVVLPNTIFGIRKVSNLLEKPSDRALKSTITTIVTSFCESGDNSDQINTSIKNIQTALNNLNQHATLIFYQGFMLSRWVELENYHQEDPGYVGKKLDSFFKNRYVQKARTGMEYFNSFFLFENLGAFLVNPLIWAPTHLTNMAISYALPGWGIIPESIPWLSNPIPQLMMLQFATNITELVTRSHILKQHPHKQEITLTMNAFLDSLKNAVASIQALLNTSDNDVLQLISNHLTLPATISGNWDNVNTIVRVLDLIGSVDAAIAILTACKSSEFDYNIIKGIRLNTALPTTVVERMGIKMPCIKPLRVIPVLYSHETPLESSLEKLWNIGNSENIPFEHVTHDSESIDVSFSDETASNRFMLNLLLSQTARIALQFSARDDISNDAFVALREVNMGKVIIISNTMYNMYTGSLHTPLKLMTYLPSVA